VGLLALVAALALLGGPAFGFAVLGAIGFVAVSLAAGACTAVTVGGCGFVFGALVAGSANLLLTSAYNRTSLTSLTGTGAL